MGNNQFVDKITNETFNDWHIFYARLVCLNMKNVSLVEIGIVEQIQNSNIYKSHFKNFHEFFFLCFSGMYFASSMILVSFSCAMTVLVLNIHFRGATGNKLPNWMRKLFLNRLAWILFVKTGKAASNKVHSEKKDTEKQVTEKYAFNRSTLIVLM